MPIYTKGGDLGETGLFGNQRVSKTHDRVEAYGAVDELNAFIGVLRAEASLPQGRDQELQGIQDTLFEVGADLATPPPADGRTRPQTPDLPVDRVDQMEAWMDEADSELPELRAFVLPGGSRGGAALHIARTACRRAEREVVALADVDHVSPEVVAWLNRCADLFFVLARLANHRAGEGDIEWQKPG